MFYLYAIPRISSAVDSPCMQLRANFCIVLGKLDKRLLDAGVEHNLQAGLSNKRCKDLTTHPFSNTQSMHAVMNHRL